MEKIISHKDLLVWQRGMAEWRAASDVPQVAALFADAPPPLPPQS